jgi:hypothetical protein
MQSMDADGPEQLQTKRGYQGYEGNRGSQSYAGQTNYDPYGQGGQAMPGGVDDDFADAVAARIAQQFNQGPGGKIYGNVRRDNHLSAGQRVAIAIVSVVMLVPLAAITLGINAQGFGFLAFIVACGAIALINIAFSLSSRS